MGLSGVALGHCPIDTWRSKSIVQLRRLRKIIDAFRAAVRVVLDDQCVLIAHGAWNCAVFRLNSWIVRKAVGLAFKQLCFLGRIQRLVQFELW